MSESKDVSSIGAFVDIVSKLSNENIEVVCVCIQAVKVGDYLLYEDGEYIDEVYTKKNSCRRVCAIGGEQSSGPNPERAFIALTGDPRIKSYTTNPDVMVLREVK